MQLPPLHPILVNFTAALVPVSFASDLLGKLARRESLRSTAFWTLLFAAVISPFTALAGWLWLRNMGGMDDLTMLVHKWLGTTLSVLFASLALWRWRIQRRAAPIGAMYLIVAGVLVGALTVQGDLGGTMSFKTANDAATHENHHDHDQRPLEWRDHIDVKD